MDKLFNSSEIYNSFSAIHNSTPPNFSAEQLFNSVNNQFSSFDPMTKQNFLTFLVEDYSFFQNIPNIFEKISDLGNQLLKSDNFSSQITALTTLTKLFLNLPNLDQEKQGKFNDFMSMLFSKSVDLNEVPHLRNICSQCLQEINTIKGPGFVPYPASKFLGSAAENHAPTAYSELAFCNGCDQSELAKFLDTRFWSMSPLESSLFAPKFYPKLPTTPNDPLLLRNAIEKGDVSKETALSLINNPFSAYGVPQTIYGFTDTFEFDASSLFSPFDKDDTIAAKSNLLPHKMSSIDSSSVLSSFPQQSPNSAIVSAVFNLASMFEPKEIYLFYRRFYEKTPNFDQQWFNLYDNIDQSSKDTVKCFLIQYPTRKSAQKAILSSDDGRIPLSFIENVDEETVHLLPSLLPKLSAEKALLAKEKMAKYSIQQNLESVECHFSSSSQLLQVTSVQVETTELIKTQITVHVKPIAEMQSPLFAPCFRLEKGSIFADNGFISLPLIDSEVTITFNMKPSRIESDSLRLICEYTSQDGQPHWFSLGDISVESHDLLSPSDVDFKTAWNEGEESRVLLPLKFQQVVSAMNKTVFGKNPNCEREENRLQSVVSTPMGSTVAIIAVASGQQTVLHFRAPSLDILEIIDLFIRSLAA